MRGQGEGVLRWEAGGVGDGGAGGEGVGEVVDVFAEGDVGGAG